MSLIQPQIMKTARPSRDAGVRERLPNATDSPTWCRGLHIGEVAQFSSTPADRAYLVLPLVRYLVALITTLNIVETIEVGLPVTRFALHQLICVECLADIPRSGLLRDGDSIAVRTTRWWTPRRRCWSGAN